MTNDGLDSLGSEARRSPTRMAPKAVFVLMVVPWAVTVLSLLVYLAVYASRPGPMGTTLSHWPKKAAVPRDAGVTALIMFVHPQCPCSRASVSELDRLVSAFPGKVRATVVFLRPSDRSEDWVKNDLWASVQRIPGASAMEDPDGREIKRFGAKTSGETVAFSPEGKEIFRGGLTPFRGHEGQSIGTTALGRYLSGEGMPIRSAPTYGCALQNPTMESRTQ